MTLDHDAARAVRTYLLASGYTPQGVLARVGPAAFDALASGLLAPMRRALADPPAQPVDPLIRLFLLGDPVPACALPPPVAEALGRLGLATVQDVEGVSHLVALLDVRPYGEPDTDWYLVSDLGAPAESDHVLGVGGASLTLARITPRTMVARALDLGCGSGVQVAHLARHARHVTATDLNERALHVAGLTAALSGVPAEQLDLRAGSLFEPVAGQQFDLIVSNPPFVVSPGHRFTYRDAGLPGDEVSRRVVRDAAAHLTPGGRAVVLANWLHVAGEDWRDRVADWLAGTGVSAWIVQRDTEPVAQYAATWLRDGGIAEGAALEASLDEWLDVFATWNAQAVGFGWAVLVAPTATSAGEEPWRHLEDLSQTPRLPSGDEVEAFLRGCERVERMTLPALLAAPFQLANGATITTERHRLDGSELTAPPRVGLTGRVGPGGWRATMPVPPALLAALLDNSDTPIGARLDIAAQAEGLDPLDVLPTAVIALRELLRLGIVRTV
ncbi:MAG TPA: class I SAM-dependent methyltransferase [Candidatus Nanopelagicales bacterium]